MTELTAGKSAPQDCEWAINGLRYGGLRWCNGSAKIKILALHGWLDNAASFTRLAPLIDNAEIVAVDLSGHGRSSWRSQDSGYQIWEDLPELVGIMDALGWSRCVLLGHSRGAGIAALLAASFPERCETLLLLDGLLPPPQEPDQFCVQMRKYVDDKSGFLNKPTRNLKSLEAGIEARKKRGFSDYAARVLVERGTLENSSGLAWSTDPRLMGASSIKLSDDQLRAVCAALKTQVLLIKASEGIVKVLSAVGGKFSGLIEKLDIVEIEGDHHLHLSTRGAIAVAEVINKQLTKS